MGWTRVSTVALAVVVLAGCGVDADLEAEDGPDDDFTIAGTADAFGVRDRTPEACAVLKLANLASLDELDLTARLSASAARAIVAFRAGPDGVEGTDDDRWIRDLAELDAIRYVGPATFRRMRDYTRAGAYACGEVPVQLLAFNDFHGNLEPPSGSSGRIQTGPNPAVDRVDAGGAELMATHLARLRAESPNTLVVAAGDLIGATPLLSALFHDEPTIESMNLMQLAVASIGNHELDEGLDELRRMQFGGCHPVDGCQDGTPFGGAAFEYLAANVIEDASGETIFPAWTERRFGAARLAFIGLTLENTPAVTTAAGVRGLTFHDEADTINALVPEIRAAGIETIVVLIHEGGFVSGRYDECVGASGPLFEIVRRLDPAIGVVVAGHTNAAHLCEIDGRLVTSAAHAGRLVTDVDLTIDEVTGAIVSRSARNVIVTRDVPRDAGQTALIARYAEIAAPLANRVVGVLGSDVLRAANAAGESALGNLIADAQLAATSAPEAGGAHLALMNPGGIRADLVHAQVSGGEAPGEVTYGEAFAVQPFGNTLMTVTLTGAQLHALLEQQWSVSDGVERQMILAPSRTLRYAWSPGRPVGARIDPASITIDGAPLELAASYRVTANNFLADGGDGFTMLREGTDRSPGPLDLDPLTAYLAAHSPVASPPRDRIVLVTP
ncbi:MAG: bifunctional metallophosphatase/5'-nucleotidase [Sandaracinaceae bacterium]|nr:bifunctional metallophosphatase/5'-nucleotidase [Sandaracinaceae bacterium]